MIQSTSRGAPSYATGKLLYRGAEADVIAGTWQGRDAVFKVRKPLPYRLEILDESIRRQRTLREAEMFHRARVAGVEVPRLLYLDPDGSTIVMERVRGTRLKDDVESLSAPKLRRAFNELGRSAGKIHRGGLMHGDLTTANVVIRGKDLVLLDFGLAVPSHRVEDHAVDLRLIKETLVGAHPEAAQEAFASLTDGYRAEVGDRRSSAVFRQLKNIERRGRYARMA